MNVNFKWSGTTTVLLTLELGRWYSSSPECLYHQLKRGIWIG